MVVELKELMPRVVVGFVMDTRRMVALQEVQSSSEILEEPMVG